jgi:hypothetical protein
VRTLRLILLLLPTALAGLPQPSGAITLTEIIDPTGDGAGNALTWPDGIAVDSQRNVYVAGQLSDNVFKITPAGVITEFMDPTGDGAGNELDLASGVVVDSLDNVYIASQKTARVFKVEPGGAVSTIIDPNGDGAGNELQIARFLTIDDADNILVTGRSEVFEVTPGGTVTEIIDGTGDGLGNPCSSTTMARRGPFGNIFVACQGTAQNVFKITPGGGISLILDDSGDGVHAFGTANDLAIDAAGNVYVPGAAADNVFKITPNGSITQIMDSTGDGAGNPLHFPAPIDVDAHGNVFVGGRTSENVFMITPSGEITAILIGDGTGTFFTSPWRIIAEESGVYVTGFNSSNAFRIEYTASDLAIDFTLGSGSAPFVDSVLGWEFTVGAPVEVLAIGLWDETGNGLSNGHDVGIYRLDDEQLLTSINISGGFDTTSTSANGSWRFQDVTPFTLASGSYVIAGTYEGVRTQPPGPILALDPGPDERIRPDRTRARDPQDLGHHRAVFHQLGVDRGHQPDPRGCGPGRARRLRLLDVDRRSASDAVQHCSLEHCAHRPTRARRRRRQDPGRVPDLPPARRGPGPADVRVHGIRLPVSQRP